jgi:L-malate glycosyltransferase
VKLLWTISNWKHTGPLEPSLDLAAAVAALGHDVQVAVGRPPTGRDAEAEACATDRGLALASTGATLSKHSAPLRDLRDARRLGHLIDAERFDAVVATQRSDHRLLLRAARGGSRPLVARLWFEDGTSPPDRRDALALRRSDLVFAFSETARRAVCTAGVEPDRVAQTGPPLDVATLRSRSASASDVRARYGIGRHVFLLGIVARLQLHRRFEMLWDAVAALKERGVAFHLLTVGRGTNQEQVGHRPVAERALADRVTFTGYLRGDAYVRALQAMQAQIFLVPGSDPTCRALREGMSLGVPSLATRRGMLPELVVHGATGLVIDESADALAAAMEQLAADPAASARYGRAARERADALFDARRVAATVIERIEHRLAGRAPA